MTRSTTTPLLVANDAPPRLLEKLILGKGNYNEAWLQERIASHPTLLPVCDIEPGFGELISVAREIPCASGFIDNLYVTPSGDIVLVETKLWSNSEARRKVVTQTLDYIAALMRMDCATFEAAVMKGMRPTGAPASLHGMIAERPDALDEARFRDAVSRNLKRGRLLALIVGDGIREEAELLATLVQGHAGAHFTLALVSLGAWRDPRTGATLIVPDILARTAMIERGIVQILDGTVTIAAAKADPGPAQNITEQDYYAELARVDPALPAMLQAFLKRLEPYGVYPEVRRSLILRADIPSRPRPLSFGYIDRTGRYWSNDLEGTAGPALSRPYAQAVAALIGGVVTRQGSHVTTNGTSAPMVTQLLPTKADGWEAAIRDTIVAAENGAGDIAA